MAMKGRHRPASTAGYLTNEVRRDDVLELRGPVAGYFVWSGLPTAPTPNRHDRCSWWPEELAVDAEVRALGSPAVPAVHGFERESNHCPGFTAFRDTGKPPTCDMGHLGVQKHRSAAERGPQGAAFRCRSGSRSRW
jgi:hypothetical protein